MVAISNRAHLITVAWSSPPPTKALPSFYLLNAFFFEGNEQLGTTPKPIIRGRSQSHGVGGGGGGGGGGGSNINATFVVSVVVT
jgi:hypothetical protein